MDFKRFKTYLFENNINYEKASKDIGIAISSFANKINGKTSWTYNELLKIKELYSMPDDLFILIFFN